MSYKPYQSCLIPHTDEIVALRRRKPPMPYAQIAGLLREKYQIVVRRETIFRFLKVRAKGHRVCKYAWNVQPTKPETVSQPQTVNLPPTAPAPKPNPTPKPEPDFVFPFSERYNLRRLPPEEAAARRKKLEEREKMMRG